ncbi:hypothetical protein [Floridanema aerugineum]|jgi:hypothetical protein|uniref:Uncharacterized protein n=1 Tax=Floridaenema aerugineum BLCC-F46 TaxID=3153654 RepID=A0ABV4X121_9CYAN
MHSQDSSIQVNFLFRDGHSESFKLPISPQEFQQQLEGLLAKPWLTFHLRDQTVVISTSQIMKVEIKPPLSQLEGEGIFANSERVTALNRGAR